MTPELWAALLVLAAGNILLVLRYEAQRDRWMERQAELTRHALETYERLSKASEAERARLLNRIQHPQLVNGEAPTRTRFRHLGDEEEAEYAERTGNGNTGS